MQIEAFCCPSNKTLANLLSSKVAFSDAVKSAIRKKFLGGKPQNPNSKRH